MALKIRRVGLEQYAPGGKARIKLMNIGGPGAGKTRFASYWPSPIWADCEGGLGSVADRGIAAGEIQTSDDMLEFLEEMKRESAKPDSQREFHTVVIDTLDAFQRKVKDEWLQKNPNAQSFRGFDAWGYLDSKMQMLLTRLLNLDMNVIVNVHYKDKIIKEGSGDQALERVEHVLQLSGDVKDSAFNDFDLVGWMGTFWAPGPDGGRVQKRGLTFNPTPEKPFLKDRLHFTPKFFEVTFSDNDYIGLFEPLQKRIQEVRNEVGEGGEVVREISHSPEFGPVGGGVVHPGTVQAGALPPQDPRDVPLTQYQKPELQQFARLLEIPFKGNTLKGELIAAIDAKGGMDAVIAAREAGRAAAAEAAKRFEAAVVESGPIEVVATTETQAAVAEVVAETVAQTDEAASASPEEVVSLEAVAAGEVELAPEDIPECGEPSGVDGIPACVYDQGHSNGVGHSWQRKLEEYEASQKLLAEEAVKAAEAAAAEAAASTPVETVATEAGDVDAATGEVVEVADVAAALGATVVEEIEQVEEPPTALQPPAPAPAANPAGGPDEHCGHKDCGKALGGTDENQDYVKLSFIKFQTRLCNRHFLECKKTGQTGPQLRAAGVIS